MASTLVAGRVEEGIASRAETLIKHAGLTNSEVIKIVWQNIVDTGKLPAPARNQATRNAYSRLLELRADSMSNTALAELTPDDERKILSERAL